MIWPASPAQLISAQRELAASAPEVWRPPTESLLIGACFVCFGRGQTALGAHGDPAWAAAAVTRSRQTLGEATVTGVAGAPYIPGLLALREGPSLEAAVRALDLKPHVLLVDATGRDHPRRAGMALQLGAVLELPTVGITHRPLLAYGPPPADDRGATAPLSLDDEVVAAWLRTRRGARPLVVHPAWRTDLEVAIEVVHAATAGHRTPEPLRRARMLARVARAGDYQARR